LTVVDHRMAVRESFEHTALSGSRFLKPPALPVVTDSEGREFPGDRRRGA